MDKKIGLALMMLFGLTGCVQHEDGTRPLAWWVWLIIILLIAVVFWLIFRPKGEEKTSTSEQYPTKTEPVVESVSAVPVVDLPAPVMVEPPIEPMSFEPDDLKIIEGIGPKINSILHAAGVLTFNQLAEMDPNKIMELLTAAGIRLAEPSP